MKTLVVVRPHDAITWREGEMEERDTTEEVVDRVAEAVRHALRLVGPTERGLERVGETLKDRPAA